MSHEPTSDLSSFARERPHVAEFARVARPVVPDENLNAVGHGDADDSIGGRLKPSPSAFLTRLKELATRDRI
jgi:hypothetical protein